LDGSVGELRVLFALGTCSTGIAIDRERRRIFFGDLHAGRVLVYGADSGRFIAEAPAVAAWTQWGSASDVAVIDGVLVTVSHASACLHFRRRHSATDLTAPSRVRSLSD
jgi:hypothetical protein